jgi:hypothetical protein
MMPVLSEWWTLWSRTSPLGGAINQTIMSGVGGKCKRMIAEPARSSRMVSMWRWDRFGGYVGHGCVSRGWSVVLTLPRDDVVTRSVTTTLAGVTLE